MTGNEALDLRRSIRGLTIPDVVDRASAGAPVEALVFPDDRADYSDLAARSRRMADGLRGLGVQAGDHVGYLLPNGIEIMALLLGVLRLGAVAVPINGRYKAEEIAYVVENGDCSVVLVGDHHLDEVGIALGGDRARIPTLRHVVGGEGRSGFVSWDEFRSGAVPGEDTPADPDLMALILYTSGTTSRPKGVMLSQSAVLMASAALAERMALTPDDRWWTPLPLFHIAAIATVCAAFVAGCTIVHPGMFEPGSSIEQMERERPTLAFPAFETIWLAVLDHPSFVDADLSSLRRIINIGVPERLQAMQERTPFAIQVSSTGSTESAGFLGIGVVEDSLDDRINTNGFPMPGMEVRVVDIETGDDVEAPGRGELLYRGPSMLLGYYRDPEITAERIDADGWFHSGDVYGIDTAGRITFLERLKDMLKVGGENVAAAEVEGFLALHPAVRIVQVVAAPDARYIEVPCAFVELNADREVTESELIDWCRGRISTFKIPRYVRFVDEWPMSGTKIRKVDLRDRIATELAERGITEAPRISSR